VTLRPASAWCCALALSCTAAVVSAQDAQPVDPPTVTVNGDPTSPSAPSDEQTAEAQRLFAQGVALAGEERWGDAVAYFRRSRALVERPGTVFNIAVALVRLGRASDALEALGDFLRIADPLTDGVRRAQAERMQALVSATIVSVELSVSPTDARVVVDGIARVERGGLRILSLDPGRHTLIVSAPDHAERRLEISTLPGETTRVAVRLTPTTGRLLVITTPRDAQLRIDGALVDTTRESNGALSVSLTPGRHRLRVDADGREPAERSVTLRAGARTTLHLDLAPERLSVLQSPIFWIVTGVVAASAGVAIGVAASGTDAPYAGSTGIVLGD